MQHTVAAASASPRRSTQRPTSLSLPPSASKPGPGDLLTRIVALQAMSAPRAEATARVPCNPVVPVRYPSSVQQAPQAAQHEAQGRCRQQQALRRMPVLCFSGSHGPALRLGHVAGSAVADPATCMHVHCNSSGRPSPQTATPCIKLNGTAECNSALKVPQESLSASVASSRNALRHS